MTVLDTSGAVDYLLGTGAAAEVAALFAAEGRLAAPDLLVFETLAVLRREVARGSLAAARAAGAVEDLGDLSVEWFAGLGLRRRAWELRENLTAGDGLFVALAELIGEPLATKDRGLAGAARMHAAVETIELGSP